MIECADHYEYYDAVGTFNVWTTVCIHLTHVNVKCCHVAAMYTLDNNTSLSVCGWCGVILNNYWTLQYVIATLQQYNKPRSVHHMQCSHI